jgi:hypothetical protein
MYPWLWFWSPQFHFPFSGSVAQRIDPDFFSRIPPEAGNGEVEKQIADIASYGRQLGWLTEVLLSHTSPGTVPPEQAMEAQAKLETTYREIETVKRLNKAKLSRSAMAVLEKLEATDPDALALVLARFAQTTPRRLTSEGAAAKR